MTDYANPTEQLLRSIDVRLVLPQRYPFVMIGCLTQYRSDTSTTETVIARDNIFVDDRGLFGAAGIMENIAQTCAARIGYFNKFVLHNQVAVGFIGAIKSFEIHSLPAAGSLLTTTVDIIEEVFGMTLALARVRCGDRLVADAEIKLAVKKSDA